MLNSWGLTTINQLPASVFLYLNAFKYFTANTEINRNMDTKLVDAN